MIIPNGYIEIKEVSVVGGINPQTDFPTPAQGEWSGHIACQYLPKSYRHAKEVNSEFYTQASYEILVDELDVQSLKPTLIRLTDEGGHILGEYPVISVWHHKGARIFKITV
jgi:hypothetical protein